MNLKLYKRETKAKMQRNKQRRATNAALRKPVCSTRNQSCQRKETSETVHDSEYALEIAHDSEEESDSLNLSDTTYTEESSDLPLAKELGNYVDDSITDAELALFFSADICPVFNNNQIGLGYTGIMNCHQTCYFNSLLQLFSAGYRTLAAK